MDKSKRKKVNGWKIVALLLTIVLVFSVSIFFAKDYIMAKAENKVQDVLIENVLKAAITSNSEGTVQAAEEAKDLYDSMTEEDKSIARSLLDNKLTTENVSQALEYVKIGDLSGLETYAKEMFTEGDKEQLQGLYEKYKDQLN